MRYLMFGVLIAACFVGGWFVASPHAERAPCLATRRPVRDIPRITLDDNELRFRGIRIIATAAMIDGPSLKIDRLFELLTAEHVASCDGRAVCLDNLVVFEDQATGYASGWQSPGQLILRTAWLAGYDVVMAPTIPKTW